MSFIKDIIRLSNGPLGFENWRNASKNSVEGDPLGKGGPVYGSAVTPEEKKSAVDLSQKLKLK